MLSRIFKTFKAKVFIMSSSLRDLIDPICDLRYLLDRGYKRDSALDFVAGRYTLDADARNLLLRTVFSDGEAADHKRRLMGSGEIAGQMVIIDGFNVLISVETALDGGDLYLCDDGFLRDTQATYAKYKISDQTRPALEAIVGVLKSLGAEETFFLFDAPVSFSGEVAGMARNALEKVDLEGDAETSATVDSDIVKSGKVACTSDRAIIERVEKVIDVPRLIAKKVITLPDCGKKI
jgi:hypothetical protein